MDNLQIGEQFKVKTASSDGLNLRTEATTKATTGAGKEKNIILSIPNDAKVTLESDKVQTSDKRTWYNVRYTDKDKKDLIGWVASDYLEELLPPFSLPTLSFSALLANHPGQEAVVCDLTAFKNQCAIKMGVALEKSGVDLSFFQGERCSGNFKPPHIPGHRHILRAQELADWLRKRTKLVGKVEISKPVPWDAYKGKKGIVFFQNVTGLEGIDHIDVFDGLALKNGCKLGKRNLDWVAVCEYIWFWDLCPCTMKAGTKGVYARSEPDIKSDKRWGLVPNEGVEVVLPIQENWVQVKAKDGRLGFVERKYVSIPGQAVAPVVAPKAAPVSLPTLSWSGLWDNDPSPEYTCDQATLRNQSAVRMGGTLKKSGVDLSSFQGARCSKHDPSHILYAQELADWLRTQTKLVGNVKTYEKVTQKDLEDLKKKRGIIFIQKPTENRGVDHIDLWSVYLKSKGGDFSRWVSACEQVWFWDLLPCMTNSEIDEVPVYPVYSKAHDTAMRERIQQALDVGRTITQEHADWLLEVKSSILEEIAPNQPLEVVKVEEDWVIVDVAKYRDMAKVGPVLGFIERKFVSFPDQAVAA
jgi:hypothetical protein